MIAIRLFDRDTALNMLKPYGCEKISQHDEGFEVWKTGWGEAFTLRPEHDGKYDMWQIQTAVVGIVARTMPPDWEVILT